MDFFSLTLREGGGGNKPSSSVHHILIFLLKAQNLTLTRLNLGAACQGLFLSNMRIAFSDTSEASSGADLHFWAFQEPEHLSVLQMTPFL